MNSLGGCIKTTTYILCARISSYNVGNRPETSLNVRIYLRRVTLCYCINYAMPQTAEKLKLILGENGRMYFNYFRTRYLNRAAESSFIK